MPISHNLGFPHLGAARRLKRATEGYWGGKVSQADLLKTGAALRERHWRLQQDAGIDLVPSSDFSYYDRVLDTCTLVGAVPKRYGWAGGPVDLDTYFAMARGVQAGGRDVTAMEMTKWFDTNYHYIVPEFEPGQAFRLSSSKPVDEFREAKALGIETKPVLIGPVTFLLLGKTRTARFDRLALLDALLPVYADVVSRLAEAGATWVQLDEPCLALDRTPAEREAFARAYRFLADQAPKVKLLVATYFGALDDNLATALELPVAGLHVDAVRTGTRLGPLLQAWPAGGGREGKILSLGVIDGRNIWKADLGAALRQLDDALEHDDHRVVPPAGRSPRRAETAARRPADGGRVRCVHRRADHAHPEAPGGAGTGRAGARRVRAQRYGGVLRRAARGVRLHGARVGAVVRDALREAAHHLRRRGPAQGDDGALEHVRPVHDGAPRRGHAHRPGDDPAVVA